MTVSLHPDNLGDLAPDVAVPSYDRDALARSIVHLGVGGFHRAHLAAYVDVLARQGHTDWAIVGAGVLPGDTAMAEALHAQDGLYTLVVRDVDRVDVRVIGSLVDYVHAHPNHDELIARIADPATQIVSMTVTEGGYPVDDDTGAFDPESRNAGPSSAFAVLVAGLDARRRDGAGPVTIVSCDNIIHNGAVARISTLGVAGRVDQDLADWIDREIAFPNSMVDRITPVTTDDDREWLAEAHDLRDRWPVVTEPFIQWVVEDDFAAARLPLEDLADHDVIITDDVEPYELFKLRLLNAGHSTLAYLARLVGHRMVDEVLAEDRFARFLRTFLDDEAGPVVPRAPGIDLEDYKDALVHRFANPAIGDQVDRLCLDGTSKFPKFLLPTVRAQLDRDGPITLSALALAGWCDYLLGEEEDGDPIDLAEDPRRDEAIEHARASREDPAAFLAFPIVFGDLVDDDRFVTAFTDALRSIRDLGVRATLDDLLG